MDWSGTWRNQYGSTVSIECDNHGRVGGTFRTALEDSGFYGREAAIVGVANGNCIAFSSAAASDAGDMIVSYTGLLRDGKLETMWLYVTDEAIVADGPGAMAERRPVPWWKAVISNAVTFERV